jgi:fumarate hydratase subunit alpha
MKTIESKLITQKVAELCIEANLYLSEDILCALRQAKERESSKLAKSALSTMIENAEIAKQEKLPICQDTGMVVIFVDIGQDVRVVGDINAAINEGVRQGYRDGYCRASVVLDPINRKNTGDNTPAVIHYNIVLGDSLRITLAPKGFGSENMSAICMLNPSDGIAGVEDFVVQTVDRAGANPCPPIFVGVGVGGTFEKAAILAKQALICSSDDIEPFWRDCEARLLERINNLGIGASGYGGKTTALGVRILTFPTHIAGLPVAVNINCHVSRHKTVIL